MVLCFEELRGAAGDVKELEYISSLHQTDLNNLRKDASIHAEDVRLFLISRYGIKVTVEEVRATIFAGMAGGGSEEECLDLMELVAILLMPTLLKAAEEEAGEELPHGVIRPPPGMLDYVLRMILHDVTGSSSPKPLTPDLVRSILIAYGELELAEDDTLIQEMVDAATVESSNELNVHAFGEGLTSDIRLYDIRNEVLLTTNLDAVFLDHFWEDDEETANGIPNNDAEPSAFFVAPSAREKLAIGRPLERVNTIPAIDLTAGTYRSKALMVIVWLTLLITFFAYWIGSFDDAEADCREEGFEYAYSAPWGQNVDAMACDAANSIIVWIFTFGFMAVVGLVAASLGSIGNSVDCRQAWKPALGALFMVIFVVPSYADVHRNKSSDFLLNNASLILGLVAALLHLHHGYEILVTTRKAKVFDSFKKWVPQNTVFAESKIKRAAAKKLAMMMKNSLDIVRIKDKEHIISTHYGQALQMYAKHGRKYVKAGGFQWAWKRIAGRKSFASDGIWLPARFVASNIAQYIVSLYILLYGIYLTRQVMDNYDSEGAKATLEDLVDVAFDTTVDEDMVSGLTANISSTIGRYMIYQSDSTDFGCSGFNATADEILELYCSNVTGTLQCDRNAPVNFLCSVISSPSLPLSQQMALLGGSGLDEDFLESVARESLGQAAEESVNSLYPSEKYMVAIPMIAGTVVAFLVAVYLSILYIPSVTTTILKLRCGHIPTLRDEHYRRYRVAPDQVAILTGSIFWGTFVSSVVVGGFVGVILFFFLWQATIYFAQKAVALFIGILVIILIRLGILLTCRCTMYRSFYRQRPGAANLSLLALEWANFLLSAGFVFMRMIKLLLVAGASIGRIDTPFLAPGIGRVGAIELDVYPIVHTKDILSHEAHRHPYIEQLGLMYLMKLRYAKHFGNRAGSCWRLIFVYALMPWLHKYRVQARPDRGTATSRAFSDGGGGVAVAGALVEAQYPSLQFVSLHNLRLRSSIVAHDDDDDDDNDDGEILDINDNDDEVMDDVAVAISARNMAATLAAGQYQQQPKMFPRAADIQDRRVTFLLDKKNTDKSTAVEKDNKEENTSSRIQELEAEVERLSAELARVSRQNADNPVIHTVDA